MIGNCLENVREVSPLVHCITNYVTVNDVANIILATGASPIMADEAGEIKDISNISSGLYINIGTLNQRCIRSMYKAGKVAKRNNVPVLLDPVGAGASKLRTKTALGIIKKVKPQVIRGNISEIKALQSGSNLTKGVDANCLDEVTEENIDEMTEYIKKFAKKTGAVTVATGRIDLVSDGDKCYVIKNGDKMMSMITGTGCMLSGICAAFMCANPNNLTEAIAAAVCMMGIAGEIGVTIMNENSGNITLRNNIINKICNMSVDELNTGANYEIR